MNFKIFVITILLSCSSTYLIGQSEILRSQVLSELEKRGLTEEEASTALIENGYDIDNLENIAPSEFDNIQAIIEQLQKEKAAISKENTVSEQVTDLNTLQETEAIKDTIIEDVEEYFEEKTNTEPISPINIYGQELFRNKTIRVYQESQEIKAPDHYIIGPGDEIGISIFGASSLDEQYTVSKDGDIKIGRGNIRIFLKGLKFSDAKKKLFQRFRTFNNFTEGQFAVTLNYSRTIQVSIYGEVMNQGPITIPAINTAFSALVAANGPNNIGSIRNIKLLKTNGVVSAIDVYKYINDPTIGQDFYLDDGDIITVPVAQNVVKIQGAIKRPLKYELLENEGLKELIKYAGGLTENAYKKTIQITRFENDEVVLIDVPYRDIINTNSNFVLRNGDAVNIATITETVKNYVELEGAFINTGRFERKNEMTVSDLITKAVLKKGAKIDQVFLQRKLEDQTIEYIPLNLEYILANPKTDQNLLLQDEDKITVYQKDFYVDAATFYVIGAVRNPDEFRYDVSKGIRITEAINLAGGLRRDASNIAYLQRVDPLQPDEPEYITIDLDSLLYNPESNQNFALRPYDKLLVYNRGELSIPKKISVSGAVNAPGEFVFGPGMTLKQALVLAKGVKLEAALDRIVVSRVVITDNEPTKTIVANLQIDRDLNIISSDNNNFQLQPFDAIMVRFVKEFELQEFITLKGEVAYPGRYPIISPNERISSIIERANGLTKDAFVPGASLFRSENNIGNVVINLEEILENNNSNFNFTVRDGDVLTIPKQKEFVRIEGATKIKEILNSEIIGENNLITVPFHQGKNAIFYINEYAGGINNEISNGKNVYVELPNGQIKKSRYRFPFGRKYPKVTKGSKIIVSRKAIKIEKENKEDQEDVDWTKILGDTVVQATSVLTLILLARQLD